MGFEARYRMVSNVPIPAPTLHRQDKPELRMATRQQHEMCGNPIKSPKDQRKIWGGGPITNSQWPWLGSVTCYESMSKSFRNAA